MRYCEKYSIYLKVSYQSMPYHPDMPAEIYAVHMNTGCPTGSEIN